ncbi:MAG: heat-inducible transcription repressor HrcA [Chloroflexi bacterium]|nr:heat-inducible transcription repressor HrcA [Chloroflexota bacterium]
MRDLTARQQAILGLVIREYIATATPVSSKVIVEAYGLGISSATVRNEMARLEELGYLTHPHTSAGRVPTDQGYRYFVERLLGETELPLAERRMIRHQFHQARPEMDQWLKLSASVLAQAAQSAAWITAPSAITQCLFKHLELISIRDSLALAVLVLQGGTVKQRVLTLTRPLSQEELSRMATHLNEHFDGLTADEVTAQLMRLSALEAQVGELVAEIMGRSGEPARSEVYRNGLINILQQPEFAEGQSARQVFELLEESSFLETILVDVLAPAAGGVQVIIGGEGPWEELSDCSLVLSRYGVRRHATGNLGVLGPRRMPYGRAISAVRYVANLMSELIHELYGY